MDTAVDPCEDFFEYSCGSWNRLNEIPNDRSSYNTFAKLRDIIHVQLKGKPHVKSNTTKCHTCTSCTVIVGTSNL